MAAMYVLVIKISKRHACQMSNNIGEWIMQKISNPRSNIEMSIIKILFIALREKYFKVPRTDENLALVFLINDKKS